MTDHSETFAEPRGRPSQRAGIEARRVDDVTVLFEADGSRLCALNETALALWDLCDGHTDPSEMVDAVCTACGVPRDTAAADIDQALLALTDAGLIEWTAVR